MLTKQMFPVVAISAFLTIAACASAPTDRRRPPPDRAGSNAGFSGSVAKPISLLFATMDTNDDAIVDVPELAQGLDKEWARLSKHGRVDLDAFDAWSAGILGSGGSLEAFMAYDTNLDGGMTYEEFSKRLTNEFEELDADGNGALKRSELLFRVLRGSNNRRGPPGGGRGRGSR